MATADLRTLDQPTVGHESAATRPQSKVADGNLLASFLDAISSLWLAVVLFAAAIFLILVGTLAQVDYDVWHVVRVSHFRVWWAWVEFKSIGHLVQMLVGGDWTWLRGGFYFPGGQTIGSLMLINLLAAHALRFKASARGAQLAGGLAILALGVAATVLVVVTGSGNSVKSQLSPAFTNILWHTLRACVAGLAFWGVYWLYHARSRMRLPELIMSGALVASVVAAATWLFVNSDVRLDDAGLRILWYLVKGSLAAGILLWGCLLVFKKRAGMVLLHAGRRAADVWRTAHGPAGRRSPDANH